jgi:hypothetical protein
LTLLIHIRGGGGETLAWRPAVLTETFRDSNRHFRHVALLPRLVPPTIFAINDALIVTQLDACVPLSY